MDFIKFIGWSVVVMFCIAATPFIVEHIIEHWDDPEYQHSGFSPECPNWEESEMPRHANDDWAFHNVR